MVSFKITLTSDPKLPYKVEGTKLNTLHCSVEIFSRTIQGPPSNQRHHHKRRNRHQSSADCGQRVPQARIRAQADSSRQGGQLVITTSWCQGLKFRSLYYLNFPIMQ